MRIGECECSCGVLTLARGSAAASAFVEAFGLRGGGEDAGVEDQRRAWRRQQHPPADRGMVAAGRRRTCCEVKLMWPENTGRATIVKLSYRQNRKFDLKTLSVPREELDDDESDIVALMGAVSRKASSAVWIAVGDLLGGAGGVADCFAQAVLAENLAGGVATMGVTLSSRRECARLPASCRRVAG
jgi:hypothetical protein